MNNELSKLIRITPWSTPGAHSQLAAFDKPNNIVHINKTVYDQLTPFGKQLAERCEVPSLDLSDILWWETYYPVVKATYSEEQTHESI